MPLLTLPSVARLGPLRKTSAVALAALLLATSGIAQADTLRKIKETGAITIAYRESSIPFSYVDGEQKPVGYAIDLCLKVVDAVRLQLKMPKLEVRYVPVNGATRIPALLEDKADIECGSTTNNAERREKVAFTIPHYLAGARILVRSDSKIRNLDDLSGKLVVTTKGTTAVGILRGKNDQRILGMHIVEAADHAQSFAMLSSGKAEAFVMDDVLLYSLRATSETPSATMVVGDYLSIEPLSLMLRKDDPDFKKLVDNTLMHLILDGGINKIYAKWFQSPIPPNGINLDLPMSILLRDSFRFPSDKVGD